MKKILVSIIIVLLLCTRSLPIFVGTSPTFAVSTPTEKITLAPFIHVTNSTVSQLNDGIGYVDSTVIFNSSTLPGIYTNTTEINTTPTTRALKWISFYGSSQITINNSNAPEIILYIYDSSQATVINSTISVIYSYDSSVVTVINSTISVIYSYDSSVVTIRNGSKIGSADFYNSSRIYISNSSFDFLGFILHDNSYLNAHNLTALFVAAEDFSTGQINNSTISEFGSIDAANIMVTNSTISQVYYGLVCTQGSLSIDGGNPPSGLSNCRNTTTLTNMVASPTVTLISVSALAGSSVSIINNNSITHVFSHNNSSVYLENTTAVELWITCADYSNIVYNKSLNNYFVIYAYGHSRITLQNVNTTNMVSVFLYEQSSAVLENSNISLASGYLYIDTYGQSTLDIRNTNITGTSTNGLRVWSYDSSVVHILNVNYPVPPSAANTTFVSHDLSVITINSSAVTNLGVAARSNGDMALTNDVLGGSYINTTTSDSAPTNPATLTSIAVVGTDTLTITNCSSSLVEVYVHDSAHLDTRNCPPPTLQVITLYDSSTFSGTNVTLGYFYMYDRSSASLSNSSTQILGQIYVYDSTSLTWSGNTSATSNIKYLVKVVSDFPQMANVVIDNCTVGIIMGVTWIIQAGGVDYTFLLLSFLLYSQSQGFPLLLAGAAIVVVVVAVVAVVLWRRRA